MFRTGIAWALGFALFAAPGWALGIVAPHVDGDTFTARIELLGGIEAGLTISFEDATGLTPASLGLSARLVSPLDLSILTRLPDLLSLSIPLAFPVVLKIDPPAAGGLSFEGAVTVEIHTPLLHFLPGGPLRLFAAPLGGTFYDVTADASAGSYRAGGSKPDFVGEYMIVADNRSQSSVTAQKFDRNESLLETYSSLIDPSVAAQLENLIADARYAFEHGPDFAASLEEVDGFLVLVAEEAGDGLPDEWSAGGSGTNVAANLAAAASTLRYSLELLENSEP